MVVYLCTDIMIESSTNLHIFCELSSLVLLPHSPFLSVTLHLSCPPFLPLFLPLLLPCLSLFLSLPPSISPFLLSLLPSLPPPSSVPPTLGSLVTHMWTQTTHTLRRRGLNTSIIVTPTSSTSDRDTRRGCGGGERSEYESRLFVLMLALPLLQVMC